jgi:hypothetical protein
MGVRIEIDGQQRTAAWPKGNPIQVVPIPTKQRNPDRHGAV